MSTKMLKINDKFDIEYDPQNNDLPVAVYRNGELWKAAAEILLVMNNLGTALWYKVLEQNELLESEGVNT